MAEVNFEVQEKIYTSIDYELPYYLQGGTEIEIPYVALRQEPSELFTLEFTVLRKDNYDDDKKSRNYRLKLTFENYAHEISKNYGYEIFCKLLTADDKYIPLFSHTEIRTNRSVYIFDELPDLIFIKSTHIYFYVHRFNTKECVKKNHFENCFDMLTLENSNNITIVVGDKKFYANKNVLSAKSNVFKSECAIEMHENLSGVININNFSPDVIEEMLRYIYTGKCKNLNKLSRGLFKAAHYYQIDELQTICKEYFPFILDVQNAASLLEIANLYDLQELKEAVTSFIENRKEEMVHVKTYQKYLCSNLNIKNIVHTLDLSVKYNLSNVKTYVMRYIKDHQKELAENSEFLKLFNNQPEVMKEIFVPIIE